MISRDRLIKTFTEMVQIDSPSREEEAMAQYVISKLEKFGLISLIKKKVELDNIPILGICLGMQILADKGYENKITKGLGFIPGEIKKIPTNFKCTSQRIIYYSSILNNFSSFNHFIISCWYINP